MSALGFVWALTVEFTTAATDKSMSEPIASDEPTLWTRRIDFVDASIRRKVEVDGVFAFMCFSRLVEVATAGSGAATVFVQFEAGSRPSFSLLRCSARVAT